MNYSGQKRKFTPRKWRKEDSEAEENSDVSEEEGLELSDFASLLKELLEECRKLSMLFQRSTSTMM